MPYNCLYTSGQAVYDIHVVGLLGTLISPVGPINKNLN